MKKALFSLLLLAFFLLLAGCNKKTNDNTTKGNEINASDIVVNQAYQRYDIGEKSEYSLIGFGAQMDTDIFMPWNAMTEEDEALWEKRIKEMDIKYTRIKYFPEYLERANDNDDPNVFDYESEGVDFDCAEMKALYKVLDLCQKYDIMVDFSLSGSYHWFKSYDGKYDGSWLACDSEKNKDAWVTAPNDYYEYAENLSACLQYLINVKKYTCIYGISSISESFFNESGIKVWQEYVDSCKIIAERLEKDGIRDKVKFIGCAEQGGNPKYYREEFESVKDIFDVCCTGNYSWDYRSPNESIYNYFEEMMATVKYYEKDCFAISEFCEGLHFIDAVNKTDIDEYSAGLYIARFCIEASKAGVSAFDHYILGDTYFNNSYVHTMGLWMYRDANLKNAKWQSWGCHPEYYFYSMFSKYAKRGAYSYKLNQQMKNEYDSEDPSISLVAFNNPDGGWTYFIANTATTNKKIAIVNGLSNHPAQMNCYKITESFIPEDRNDALPESSSTIDASNGVAYVSVPANGLLVVSTN